MAWRPTIGSAGVGVAVRPMALNLLDDYYDVEPEERTRRYRAILDAMGSGQFDWQTLAASFGITEDDLRHFLADFEEPDVIIFGCVDGVGLANRYGLPIRHTPAIAETTRVESLLHGDHVEVVIYCPAV